MALQFLTTAAAAALTAAALASPAARQASKTIAEVAAGHDDLTILRDLLGVTGMSEVLSGQGTFTVFAPTDDAFAKMVKDLGYPAGDADEAVGLLQVLFSKLAATRDPEGTVEDEVAEVLEYHIVTGGALKFADIEKVTEITTMKDGATIERGQAGVEKEALSDKATSITDPLIIEKDITASNGEIHLIDRVLLPFDVTPALTALIGPDVADSSLPSPPSTAPTTAPEGATATTTAPKGTTAADTTTTADSAADQSPEASSDSDSACFHAAAVVHMDDGTELAMRHLTAGHVIRTAVAAASADHSPVYAFSHRQPSGLHEFVRIEAASGRVITLSKNHYLYANGALAAAEAVAVGDQLETIDGVSPVVRTAIVMEEGLFAPHTMHGDVVVNGVLASTYTRTVHPRLAHALLAPVRALVYLGAVEPLGSLLYGGAERAADKMSKGHAQT